MVEVETELVSCALQKSSGWLAAGARLPALVTARDHRDPGGCTSQVASGERGAHVSLVGQQLVATGRVDEDDNRGVVAQPRETLPGVLAEQQVRVRSAGGSELDEGGVEVDEDEGTVDGRHLRLR